MANIKSSAWKGVLNKSKEATWVCNVWKKTFENPKVNVTGIKETWEEQIRISKKKIKQSNHEQPASKQLHTRHQQMVGAHKHTKPTFNVITNESKVMNPKVSEFNPLQRHSVSVFPHNSPNNSSRIQFTNQQTEANQKIPLRVLTPTNQPQTPKHSSTTSDCPHGSIHWLQTVLTPGTHASAAPSARSATETGNSCETPPRGHNDAPSSSSSLHTPQLIPGIISVSNKQTFSRFPGC